MNNKTWNILIIVTIIILFLISSIFVWVLYHRYFSGNQKLYSIIRSHVYEHGESKITLAELTDFEWEQAVYFSMSATPLDIYKAVGVTYDGSMDLTIGIIFVSDGEIVYHEYFPQRGIGIDLYSVRLTMDANTRESIRIFKPADVFEIGITLSEERSRSAQRFGDLHWIRAVESEKGITELMVLEE